MPEKIKFHVVHASGQDENFRATELNAHSPLTRGWASSKFCLYPQDIVIQLEKRYRVRKVQILSHQHLIASKIELYVGDLPQDSLVNLQKARYTRLGYVALSDNEQTGYKARELKSVHVDATGMFLKLVIHKNHVNKHNLYNQVGLIAINVIGDSHDDDFQQENDAPSLINQNKPDYISPLDDLAFDMYQDQEVAQIIRKLERKKQDAVLAERYDFAKRVKQAILDLQKVGEKLGKYEVEKRQAVEAEDYDKAKLKKVQMDEYRLQSYKDAEIYQLLKENEIKEASPRQTNPPQRLTGLESPRPTPLQEPVRTNQPSPLPAVPHSSREPADPIINQSSPRAEPIEDRALPAPKQSYQEVEETVAGEQIADANENSDNMTETDLREAGFVIDLFGLPLVQKAYSRNWSSKEECMNDVIDKLTEIQGDASEYRAYMKAATFLIAKLLKDPVLSVFKSSVNSLKYVLTDYVKQHKIPKSDIHYLVDKCLPELQHKSGDTNIRIRNEAKEYILEMSTYPEIKTAQYVPQYCIKLYKINTAPKLAQSHVEIVDSLYDKYKLTSGLTIDNVMKFCIHSLQHNSGQVRVKAEELIIKLYKAHGQQVRSYLPTDDDKTRKSTLYRQLFEAFDRIDGKPSKKEMEKQRQVEEAAKRAEVEALQQQIAQMKSLNANVSNAPNNKKSSKPIKKKVQDEDTISTMTKFDKTCIFCNEHNEDFTEEGLDLHYWKSCPMLKRCTNCKQVVEIAGLTEHLLTECEAKGNYSKCPRCTEAILKPEFDEHVKAKTCNVSEAKKSHCPLCHQNIPPGDASWSEHLMSSAPDACKQNPRRVAAQNKPKTNTKKPILPNTNKKKQPIRK